MRYSWYKEEYPEDRFLGKWGNYDLWYDTLDEIYVATFGATDDYITSIDKMDWDDLNDYVSDPTHREALRMARRLWEEPDPSVSPGSR